jgi:hypothetical protein
MTVCVWTARKQFVCATFKDEEARMKLGDGDDDRMTD